MSRDAQVVEFLQLKERWTWTWTKKSSKGARTVRYGISDAALDWLQSYLTGRMECVRRGTNRSTPTTVWYGVPQGSVGPPGPFIFHLVYNVQCIHCRTDWSHWESQSRPSPSPVRRWHAGPGLSPCWVCCWASVYLVDLFGGSIRLDAVKPTIQLNTSKTEILWCTTQRYQHCSLPSTSVRVGADHVLPSRSVRDLGIFIDNDVTMRSHVTKRVSGCFAVLRQLRSIRRSLADYNNNNYY